MVHLPLAPPPSTPSAWWSLDPLDAIDQLASDPSTGLTTADANHRLRAHGPNALPSPPPRPAWRRLTDQLRDGLILVLLAAAAVSFLVSGEVKTPLVITVVIALNAVLGFVQEGRAEQSLEALRRMVPVTARARRDGGLVTVPAADLVPGDIVVVEAGDRVPADGRLLTAAHLELDEAALTGESEPVAKSTIALVELADGDGRAPAVADRTNMVFSQTTVTRGRGELVVTGTGTGTEIGRVAELLEQTPTERTPLQRQLDQLGRTLAWLAGGIVALVFVIGLIRGDDVRELFLTAVALAVASIPEGLPAVVAVTLALGTQRLARRHAIVKRLAAVETLGSTSVICSDKTGTLTMNEMTATDLEIADGIDRAEVMLAVVLCNDAAVRDGVIVGDPTEGALLVLAEAEGVDPTVERAAHPRRAEVPFDSARKTMATFHRAVTDDGVEVVRMYVKGAPDVLASLMASPTDAARALAPDLAGRGRRVLAIARRDLDPDLVATRLAAGDELTDLIADLTLLARVGIVDPPRPEAAAAIAACRTAGIEVKMITGDHAATAAAIGGEIGLTGEAITGADIDALDDEALAARLPSVSVIARVTPEHKLRLVQVLRASGHVVAMTGDGVNDAPALKAADIGVAMGITGTEVTKEAASMVLADDNFATIVGAVRGGRAIYDNIVTFIRFQLSTSLGFAATFLVAGITGLASGTPFTALQILWVNLIMDGPPAMALAVDPAAPDAMTRPPRPAGEPLLTPARIRGIALAALAMAAGTLAVLQWAPSAVASTMAFTTFVLAQMLNLLNVRLPRASVFSRRTLGNGRLWGAVASVLVLQVLAVHTGVLQRLFDLRGLSAGQWLTCLAAASTVVWVEEARKVVARRRAR